METSSAAFPGIANATVNPITWNIRDILSLLEHDRLALLDPHKRNRGSMRRSNGFHDSLSFRPKTEEFLREKPAASTIW